MKYEVEIPEHIDRRLAAQAAAEQEEVPRLIEVAVEQYVLRIERNGSTNALLPDPPIITGEMSAPFDLPLRGEHRPVISLVAPRTSLRPDPPILDE